MTLSSLPGGPRRGVLAAVSLAFVSLAAAPSAFAIEPPQKKDVLRRGYQNPILDVGPSLSTIAGERMADRAAAERLAANQRSVAALQRVMDRSSAEWEIRWDARSDRPHLIQGAGYALLPGAGNRLRNEDLGLSAAPKRADVERALRSFLRENPDLFRVAPGDLRLDTSRTTEVGNGRVWFVEFQQTFRGVPVEGANVFFRINNGNIVQFGADRVGDVKLASTQPQIARDRGFARLLSYLGMRSAVISEKVDAGSLKIYPTLRAGEAPGQEYRGTRGRGYGHALAWEYVFRRQGDHSTYKGVVDARSGKVLYVADLTVTAQAQVSGGIYPVTNTDPEVVRPFPFANVTNGTTKITDASGNYDWTGGSSSVTLNGRYIRINDNCGSISASGDASGNVAFGTSSGTDCSTPGSGGAGNTHAARSGYYHLTNINRKAATFFPSNNWLNGTLQANMNINLTCNAFWNGSTVNFYRSGGGCANTGELAAVFLHEWGHGMDTNSGGSANENGSGEAVGDTFAFLETKDSCIGHNFKPGINCFNCTNCTGVRDVGDFSVAGGATGSKIAKPSTVTADTGINCDRWSCPYLANGITPYQGPMGYEGHCESYIASSANWDLAQSLVSTYGTTAGWAAMDSIWYESLTPSKSAYQVASGGKCNTAAVVNGCGSTNWYTVYLSVDDDDGNLANGTPNGCLIWDAFNAHGIACGTRPACSGGCTPSATADAGPDRSISSGGSTTIGTAALANHTYSWSPGGATTAQVTVSPTSTTTYTVTATTACGSANDSVTVTVTGGGDTQAPSVPTGLSASAGKKKVTLSWNASTDNVGVTGYRVLRASSASGPFTQIATATGTTYTNTGLQSRVTYWFQVQAHDAAGNVSASSATVSATPR